MDLFFATKIQQGGPGPETHKVLDYLQNGKDVLDANLERLKPMAKQLMSASHHQKRIISICVQYRFFDSFLFS